MGSQLRLPQALARQRCHPTGCQDIVWPRSVLPRHLAGHHTLLQCPAQPGGRAQGMGKMGTSPFCSPEWETEREEGGQSTGCRQGCVGQRGQWGRWGCCGTHPSSVKAVCSSQTCQALLQEPGCGRRCQGFTDFLKEQPQQGEEVLLVA